MLLIYINKAKEILKNTLLFLADVKKVIYTFLSVCGKKCYTTNVYKTIEMS